MTCTCVECPHCGGTGYVWRAYDGTYLGRHRRDDFDEMESCDECGGTGIDQMCTECADAIADEEEKSMEY